MLKNYLKLPTPVFVNTEDFFAHKKVCNFLLLYTNTYTLHKNMHFIYMYIHDRTYTHLALETYFCILKRRCILIKFGVNINLKLLFNTRDVSIKFQNYPNTLETWVETNSYHPNRDK